MTADPQGKPNVSKQLVIKNPLLESLSEALKNLTWTPTNFVYLENYSTSFFEGLTPTMANTHLVIDKISGTDPDQDVESFIQLIERKNNFAVEDAPGDAGELANCTFKKKSAVFFFTPRTSRWVVWE